MRYCPCICPSCSSCSGYDTGARPWSRADLALDVASAVVLVAVLADLLVRARP